MTSFNFGANDKQPKLPFEEIKNETETINQEGSTPGNETTIGNEENKTESEPVQMGLCNRNDEQGTEQPTTLPDSGYRYPD